MGPYFVISPRALKISEPALVTSPLGHSVKVNRLYRNRPIIIQDREFSANFIAMPFREFDLILGID